MVLHQLQHKEDEYRAAYPSWMDQEVVPDDIQTQWQEARANRRMQFKEGDYKDSNIRMLTGTLKCQKVSSRTPYIEARCHYRGVQDQRCLSLGYH